MKQNDVFAAFVNGRLVSGEKEKAFTDLAWNDHPAFTGVALKHLLTGADSGGGFSYHLGKIAPGAAIGEHIHDPQLETHEVIAGGGVAVGGGKAVSYRPGVIVVFPAGIRHEVRAGDEGLLLFAKFMPPLC